MKRLYIAVIMREGETISLRPDGSYSSLIGPNKNDLVNQALNLKQRYEAKGSGPYVILVGPLTQAVKPVERFVLAEL